jgi:hypothetical protein
MGIKLRRDGGTEVRSYGGTEGRSYGGTEGLRYGGTEGGVIRKTYRINLNTIYQYQITF